MNTTTLKTAQVKKMPDIKPGATVKVHQKIQEGNKERIQVFEGVVIARKHGKGVSSTITVRKVVDGVGVERIFPVHTPSIAKIEIVSVGKARRSKLYYLRTAKGRKVKLKKKAFAIAIAEEEKSIPVAETPSPETAPEKSAEQPTSETPEPKENK